MAKEDQTANVAQLSLIALAGWALPGGGYFLIGEKKRAAVVFVAIAVTFCLGIWAGSIGVVDPVGGAIWYIAQVMASPAVIVIGHITQGGAYEVFGRPNEIGQIYTGIAGLLNLLVIVDSVYRGFLKSISEQEN